MRHSNLEYSDLSYEEAMHNPGLRQAYCDQFLERRPCDAVGRIWYATDTHTIDGLMGDFAKDIKKRLGRNTPRFPPLHFKILKEDPDHMSNNTYAMSFLHPKILGRGIPQPIFIGSFAFKKEAGIDEEELTIMLSKHHYHYATDFFHGALLSDGQRVTYKDRVPPVSLRDVLQIRASVSEIAAYAEHNMTDRYHYKRSREDLKDILPSLRFDRSFSINTFEKHVLEEHIAMAKYTLRNCPPYRKGRSRPKIVEPQTK
jgi:hypothetical protein